MTDDTNVGQATLDTDNNRCARDKEEKLSFYLLDTVACTDYHAIVSIYYVSTSASVTVDEIRVVREATMFSRRAGSYPAARRLKDGHL